MVAPAQNSPAVSPVLLLVELVGSMRPLPVSGLVDKGAAADEAAEEGPSPRLRWPAANKD